MCKHMENVKSRQPCISLNSCTESSSSMWVSLKKHFLMSCVIQFKLVAVLRLLGSLCQVLGPTYDRLCIPNFDLRKGNFLLQTHSYSTIFNRAENLIEVVRTLIIIKFKISETMNCRCYHEHQANLILETPSHKP